MHLRAVPGPVLGLLAFIGFASPAVLAQEARSVSGRVVDEKGGGVAGAQVWVFGVEYSPSGAEVVPGSIAEIVTGMDGTFSVASPRRPAAAPESRFSVHGVIARAKDGRLGWSSRGIGPAQDSSELRLPLAEPTTLRGTLVDQDGRPISGAEVLPRFLYRGHRAVGEYAMLPPTLAASFGFRAVTKPDGSFALAGFPKVSLVDFRVHAGDLGTVDARWTPGKDQAVTIALDRRVATIAGRLKLPAGARLAGASSVTASRFDRGGGPGDSSPSILGTYRAAIDPEGRFQFDRVQPGQYYLNFEMDPALPFVMVGGSTNLRVEPGARAEAPSIALEPAIAITGRVIDAETGKGVEGVSVSGYAFDPQGGGQAAGFQQVRTDREGRYRLNGRPGMVQVQVNDVPLPYVQPDPSGDAQRKVDGPTEWPDLRLPRGLAIDGLAVDEAGRPVPDAEIQLAGPANRSLNMRETIRTAPDGTFRLEGLTPGPIALRAAAKDRGATSKGAVIFRAKDVTGPLKITVDPKHAFRMRGTVTDASGKPIPGVQVGLFWTRQTPSDDPRQGGSSGSRIEVGSTDDDGRFDTGPLFAGDTYHLDFQAPGYAPFQTPDVVGTPGLNKGLGRIKLAGTGGHLAGTVVGSDGRPVADAEVFNRGNGLEPVSTRTDSQGRFRLEKLFPGRKSAFARKQDYRFTTVLSEGDRDDLTIRLLRTDEPPPAWKPEAGPSADEQQALARRILTRLWEEVGRWKDDQQKRGLQSTLAPPMARIDPALALEWSEQLGGEFDTAVKLTGAEVVADLDARATVEVIRKIGEAGSSLDTLVRLATWYAETDEPRALVFAKEAVAAAKGGPIATRARLGGVLIRLGEEAEGKRLVEEVVREASQPIPGGAEPPGVLPAARALALYDPKRALAMADRAKPGFLPVPPRLALAAAVARTDPAKAAELAGTPEPSGGSREAYGLNALVEAAYRCGAAPEQGLKVVDAIQGQGARSYRIEALGWLAVAVAKRDPKRAHALIDQALALAVDGKDEGFPWRSSGGADAAAARLALCARRVGYPDMDSVLGRVLATRPMGDGVNWNVGGWSRTVALLALLDPGLARERLRQIEAAAGSMPMAGTRGGPTNRLRRDQDRPHDELVARVLAGGPEGTRAVEDALAEVGRAEGPSPQVYGLTQLATILSSSPARREAMLWGEEYDTWYPGRVPVME